MYELKSYLEDRWVSGSGQGSRLHDSTTGEPIARTSTEGLDLAAALDHARRVGGPAIRALDFAQRGEILAALAKAIHGARQELIDLSTANYGGTRGDGKFDVDGATATIAAYADLAKELGERRFLLDGEGLQLGRSPRFWGQHVKVPKRGVAVHVNAFNFPAWGFAEKFACAFLAGMPVLTKPATATALAAWRMAEVIVASELLPLGAWSFLAGSPGDLLTHLGSQDVVAFTGSAATGRRIRELPNVIAHSVAVNVEADSINAVMVAPDVERGSETWNLFLHELVREMTQKTGQKCTATRRVFIPDGAIEAAVEDLRERLGDIKWGPPLDEGVRMGPLATPAQLEDVRAGLSKLAEVAERVIGEDPGPGPGAFCAPAVFVCRDPHGCGIIHELEVFGPVITIMPYGGDAKEGAELIARGDGGLVATVYTDDLEFTRTAVLELAPFHGRVLVGSKRVAEYSTGPGLVLPSLNHGGPGRAGGGAELGGLRGLDLYLQRCAVQGPRPVLDRIL